MKNTFKYALGAVLTAAMVVPAVAQDNFPDVPENHWAYEALAKMKHEGLLVGYPDGLFRGGRPASRYEMAVAINAAYERLKSMIDALSSKVDGMGSGGGGGNTGDMDAMKQEMAAMKAAMDGMKGWGDDVANMKMMASKFEKELASLGVDVEGMKKDLADISARLAKLEKGGMPISIHGDASFFSHAGMRSGAKTGITVDGRPVGKIGGLPQDLSVFHEATLRLAGTNETGPQWHTSFVIGNFTLDHGQGRTGVGYMNDAGLEDIYLQDLTINWNDSMMKQGFSAAVGRQGVKISPYILQKPDTTPNWDNDRWDNGMYTFDGATLGFNFGGAKLSVFGGRNNNLNPVNNAGSFETISVGRTVNGGPVLGLAGGVLAPRTSFGAALNVPLAANGSLDLAYLWFTGASSGARVNVFGGEFNWKTSSIGINAGYSESNVGSNQSDNSQWHAGLKWDGTKWGINAHYRQILPFFGAPGDWGRLGTWWNPTDVEGFGADAHFNVSDKMTLSAGGKWYRGTNKGGGLTTADKINTMNANLNFKVNDAWTADFGAEWVDFKLVGSGNPFQRWYNLGLGYHVSDNAKLSILWQVSDFDAKGNGFAGAALGAGKQGGNLLTTQLSVKF